MPQHQPRRHKTNVCQIKLCGTEHQISKVMERRGGEHGWIPYHVVSEPPGFWPLAWARASWLVTEPVTWGRSKCLAEVSGRLHLLLPPYLHGLSLYHRRKLNWSGMICSSKSHVGCYPVCYALLGDCKLIILMIYLSNFPGTVFSADQYFFFLLLKMDITRALFSSLRRHVWLF